MKVIVEEVASCSSCPFCHYNSDYGRSYDSGYDCHHSKGVGRIIDDYEWDNTNNPNRLQLKVNVIPIPIDCPLPDKKDIL